MEIVENRYYNPSRINNSCYISMMALEYYFGREVFKGDGSRIIFASDSYAFRQRLNKLYPSLTAPYTSITAGQMQFPFANYYRSSGWKIDTRPAIQNAQAALTGFDLSSEYPVPVRFLQTEMDYSLTFYFSRDDDAQNCYDILMWIQNPTPKQFPFEGLMYKNYKVDIPIIMKVDNITWTNEYKENDWLEKNRIIVVRANVNIKTVLVDQYAAGTSSGLFEVLPAESDTGKFYLTETCILDFLSFKNDPLKEKENIVLSLTSQFTPDPLLEATFDAINITETSCEFIWNYNPLAEELYNTTVNIVLDSGMTIVAPLIDKSVVVSGLDAESTYNATIYFVALNGTVVKLSKTVETVLPSNRKELAGMIGLEF